MGKNSTRQMKNDVELKREFDKMCGRMGITCSDAITSRGPIAVEQKMSFLSRLDTL